jgi:putative ABC transport system permease protein
MFKTRPMRTFLTVLGVGVGIGTVLFLVSLGYGLQNVILSRISTADSLLTIDVSGGPSEELALTDASIANIRSLSQVGEVSRLKNFSAQMTLNDLATNGQVSAVDYSFLRLKGVAAMKGRVYGEKDMNAALISSAGAKLFNLDPEEIVGKTVDIALTIPNEENPELVTVIQLPRPYTITGVVEDENLSYVYVPLESLPDTVEIPQYDQLKVKVLANEVMEETRNLLIEKGFVVSALSDIIDQANKIFRIVQIVLALFGLVALVVSAIGMFNTMTITLLERTNEIGIMRAIGITRKDVRMLFLVESMLMGFLGGLGGVLIGVAAGKIANFFVNMLANRFGGASVDLFFVPMWFVGVIIGFSTFIGFVTGLYPSRRASRLNPLDALRYK